MKRFSQYLDTLSRINELDTGKDIRWFFFEGMLFANPNKWWDDFSSRASVHEGIDITYFKPSKSALKRFDETIRIPVMESEMILNICNDFLGKSIITEPFRVKSLKEFRTLYVYAHVTPMDHLCNNCVVMENETIARVCRTDKNPLIPPHLHFSCVEVPRHYPCEKLDWDLFSKNDSIRFIHPLFL